MLDENECFIGFNNYCNNFHKMNIDSFTFYGYFSIQKSLLEQEYYLENNAQKTFERIWLSVKENNGY